MPALSSNSFITITGITGYIASHIGLQALQAGHRVRGTVRSLSRSISLKEAYEREGIPASALEKRLDIVIVDDLTSQQQWGKAIKGVDGVIHVALPFDDIQDKRMIDQSIEGALSLLRAARDEPSVKRVVFTSSVLAVYSLGTYRDEPVTDKDWNDEVVRIVESGKNTEITRDTYWNIYSASKTRSEKAAWDFMARENPKFDLVTILPGTNFGPVLHGNAPSTAALLEDALKGDVSRISLSPGVWFVDVRDNGRLHILGLTTPFLSGKRLWSAAEPYGWNGVFAILRKHFPDLPVPGDFEGGEDDRQMVNNSLSTEMLGEWISFEKSVVDTAQSFGY